MPLPTIFANTTSPTGQQLDQCLGAVANMGMWNCTASGTNTVALTTTSNQPSVGIYLDRQRFSGVWAGNSTGSVTVGVNSLAQLPLYLISGTQAGNGDLLSGKPFIIEYLSALNSGGGGFQFLSAQPNNTAVPVANSSIQGLLIFNNASTPSTKLQMTAYQALMITSAGLPKFVLAPSVTIDLTTTGANGMDTGSRPTSGWVYCYYINNGSVTAGLATATSPSAGSPTFPSGYNYAAYAGAMYCDGSQNLLRTLQTGRQATYRLTSGSNTTIPPNIANGVAGTVSNTDPAFDAVSVRGNGFVTPLTAGMIMLLLTTNWKAAGNATVMVGQNNAWAGTGQGIVGANGNIPPFLGTASTILTAEFELMLEANQMGWASSGAGGAISCLGWTDYYSAAG